MDRILVVDDEEHIRDLYSLELSSDGYDVETAASGYNLLKDIELLRPDVIILDIRLANHDGLDLLLEIRKRHADLPIILCSAYDSFRDDARAIAADAYVVKSFDLSELKMKIQRVIEARTTTGREFLAASAKARGSQTEETTSRIVERRMKCTG